MNIILNKTLNNKLNTTQIAEVCSLDELSCGPLILIVCKQNCQPCVRLKNNLQKMLHIESRFSKLVCNVRFCFIEKIPQNMVEHLSTLHPIYIYPTLFFFTDKRFVLAQSGTGNLSSPYTCSETIQDIFVNNINITKQNN